MKPVSRKDMRKNNNLVGVDNHGIQWRGVVLLYTYTESVEEKKYNEEGKEKKTTKKSVVVERHR